MRERKLYACIVCGRLVPVRSKEKCPICRQNERKAAGQLPKPTYKIPQKSKQIKRTRKRKKTNDCLTVFFNTHLELLSRNPYSILNNFIPSPSITNIAHLLPKRSFKDIQCNLENCIYLTWQEHSDFDRMMDSHEFDKLEIYFGETWENICNSLQNLLSLTQHRNKHYWAVLEYLNNRNK